MMIEGWSQMGRGARAPVMQVFTENDSRYSPNTVRKSALAFNDAGGKAELLLLPPQETDGHFVYHNAKAWASRVSRFVAGLGISNEPLVTTGCSEGRQQTAAQDRSAGTAQTAAEISSSPPILAVGVGGVNGGPNRR